MRWGLWGLGEGGEEDFVAGFDVFVEGGWKPGPVEEVY